MVKAGNVVVVVEDVVASAGVDVEFTEAGTVVEANVVGTGASDCSAEVVGEQEAHIKTMNNSGKAAGPR